MLRIPSFLRMIVTKSCGFGSTKCSTLILHRGVRKLYLSELIDSQLYQQRKTMSDRNTNSARKMYDTMALPGRIIQMVRTSDDLSNNPCLCCLNCLKCTACCGMDVDTKTYKVRWSVRIYYFI